MTSTGSAGWRAAFSAVSALPQQPDQDPGGQPGVQGGRVTDVIVRVVEQAHRGRG